MTMFVLMRCAALCCVVRAGEPGQLDLPSVKTAPLEAALSLALQLQCRTEQARWIYDVADTVLDLRKCVLNTDYNNMLRVINAVRSTDKSMAQPAVLVRAATKRRASFIDMVPGVGVAAGSKAMEARRSKLAIPSGSSAVAPPESASPRLASMQVEFQLSESTRREVQLVQDHYDNHVMIQELTLALQSRGPSGPVGELDVEGVDVEEIAVVIHKSERTRPKTAEAQLLLSSVRLIRDLRNALLEDDWETVESLLSDVATADDSLPMIDTSSTVQPPARVGFSRSAHPLSRSELLRVREELDYRHVIVELSRSLESGGVTGEIGNLNVASVTVDKLAAAMKLGDELGCPTQRAKHLHALAKLVWQVRQALVARDWDSVESLMESSSELLGLSGALPPECQVPRACTVEFGMLAAEINNRRVQQKLRAALHAGMPLGEVGHLNLSMIDVTGVETALQFAMKVGVITKQARQLTATASLIRALRRSLVDGKWDMLGALIDHATGGTDFGSVRVHPHPTRWMWACCVCARYLPSACPACWCCSSCPPRAQHWMPCGLAALMCRRPVLHLKARKSSRS